MSKVRVLHHSGEKWVSVEDLRDAMNDDDRVLEMAAMIKVAQNKGADPIDCLRRGIAYFLTQTTGLLSHEEN